MAAPFDASNASIFGDYIQLSGSGTAAPTGSSRGLSFLFASSSTGNEADTKVYLVNGTGSAALVLTEGNAFNFSVAGDSGAAQDITDGNTLTLAGGSGLASVASATDTVTFNVDITSTAALTTVADGDTLLIDDGDGGTIRKITRANLIESAPLDAIDIDGGAIDGTPIGAAARSSIQCTTLNANGDVTLGDNSTDTTTVNSSLTASQGIAIVAQSGIADDVKLFFGNNEDASIEYDENGTDELRFAGAAVTFEQNVSFDEDVTLGLTMDDVITVSGRLTASQGLLISDDRHLTFGTNGDATFEYDENGTDTLLYAGASLRISDDVKLEFGDGGDASIEYDENGTDELRFAGAAVTFEQNVSFDEDVALGLTQADVITVNGQLTASLGLLSSNIVKLADNTKLVFGANDDASFQYDESTTDTLLYEGASLRISDDVKLEFGSGGDASIEYDENGTDELRFAGAAVTFEQNASFDEDVTLGLTMADVATVAGQLTASHGLSIAAGKPIHVNAGDILLTDGQAAALEIKEASTVYMAFSTANGSEAITLGNATVAGVVPGADGVVDLGASGLQFKDIYINGAAYIDQLGEALDANSQNITGVGNLAATTIGVAGATASGDVALALPSGKDVKARAFVTYSERDLKTNIQPMSNAIDTVKKMQGVTYDLKNGGKNEVGFIADEMAQVVPEVVSFKEDGSAAGLDYGRLTSVLVEAIKAQQVQIEDLMSKLNK